MPTPITDLGDPYINLLHSFWKAVIEDVGGNAPIFGHVPSRYRGLEASERATIEKDRARELAVEFIESDNFPGWVRVTSALTNTEITADEMREAIYASH